MRRRVLFISLSGILAVAIAADLRHLLLHAQPFLSAASFSKVASFFFVPALLGAASAAFAAVKRPALAPFIAVAVTTALSLALFIVAVRMLQPYASYPEFTRELPNGAIVYSKIDHLRRAVGAFISRLTAQCFIGIMVSLAVFAAVNIGFSRSARPNSG